MPAERSKDLLRSFRSAVAVVVGEDSKPSYDEVVLEVRVFVDRLNGALPDVVEVLHAANVDAHLAEEIVDCDTKENR